MKFFLHLKKLIAITLVLAAAGSWPGYRVYKNWRNQRLVGEANQLAREGLWEDAYKKALLAYLARPDHPDCVRALAFILGRSQLPRDRAQAIALWLQLEDKGQLEETDLVEFTLSALSLNQVELIDRLLPKVLRGDNPPPDVCKAAAFFFSRQDRFETAIPFAQTYLATHPTDGEMKLALAQWMILEGSRQFLNAAQTMLMEIIQSNGAFARDALVSYVNQFTPDPGEIAVFESILWKSDDLTEPEIRVLWDLELQKNNHDFGRIKNKLKQAFERSELRHRVALIRWLNGRSLYSETLEWIDSPTALSDPDLFLAYLDALFFGSDYQTIGQLLSEKQLPIPMSLAHLYRCRLAGIEGDSATANRQWDLVIRYAEKDPEALEYVAAYAVSLKWYERSVQVYELLAKFPDRRRQALLKWIQVAEASKSLKHLLRALERFHHFYPQNTQVEIAWIYAGLLAGNEPVHLDPKLENLEKNHPTMQGVRVCRLLTAILREETDAVRQGASSLAAEVQSLPREGWKAVVACGLVLTGREEDARPILFRLDEERLLPEERALFKTWNVDL